jgi:hypothetical protein
MDRQASASSGSPLSGFGSFQPPAMNAVPGLERSMADLNMDLNVLPTPLSSTPLPGMQVLAPEAGSLANPLGVPNYSPNSDLDQQFEIHQKQVDAYRKLINPTPTAPAIAQQPAVSSGLAIPGSPFGSPLGGLNSSAGTISPTPAGLQDQDLTTPGRSRVRTAPPRPDFSIPQRAF